MNAKKMKRKKHARNANLLALIENDKWFDMPIIGLYFCCCGSDNTQ